MNYDPEVVNAAVIPNCQFPFPSALGVAKQNASAFVAWAWVINGLGSIMATLLGVLLAILLGFNPTFLFAAGIYLFAALTFFFYNRMMPN